MKNFLRISNFITIGLVMSAFLLSCDDDRFEPATITFYPALDGSGDEPAGSASGVPQTITLLTSRVLIEESQVNIRIEGNGAGYGNSYTTSPPQLEPGIVTLTIPRGANQASFTFTPKNDAFFVPEDYHYTFTIDETSNAIKSIGQKHFSMFVRDETLAFFSEDFAICPGTKFAEQVVTGVSTWGCSGFGSPDEAQSNLCREANAYNKGGSSTSNTYLIMTEPVDVTVYSNIFITADVYSRFTGAGGIKFKYSTTYSGSGNPEAAGVEWIELTEMNSKIPAAGSQQWVEGISAKLDNIGDSPLYIAIQHSGGLTTSSSSWRVDNFEIKGN